MAETRWPTDLALEALTRIRILDAEPVARAFRETWLNGRTLARDEEATAWLRSVSVPESGATVTLLWRESGRVEFGSAFFLGRLDHFYYGAAGTPIEALWEAVGELSRRYDWSAQEGIRFLLLAQEPSVHLVLAMEQVRLADWPDPRNPAYSVFADEIVLRCRPQATKKQVADAYDAVRRHRLSTAGLDAGERNRPTSSERTRDLAILGYRIWRDEFASWREAFEAYRAEHPGDAAEYVSTYTNGIRLGSFRRDTRNAYHRVTGVELVFRPGLESALSDDEGADDE